MAEDKFKLIQTPSLPRDPTMLETAAWEAMMAELHKADPSAQTWRENKVRNALTGFTVHIETTPGGPAEAIAATIRRYVENTLREGDQPFPEEVAALTRDEIDSSWPLFIRAEFSKWLPETDGFKLPEGETIEMIAAFDDDVDVKLRSLYDQKVRNSLAPDHDDFLAEVRAAAKSCCEMEMEELTTSINDALLRQAPEPSPSS